MNPSPVRISLFPFQQAISPGGCVNVTEPPASSSEGLGIITSLGNIFWVSPGPPPGSTTGAVAPGVYAILVNDMETDGLYEAANFYLTVTS